MFFPSLCQFFDDSFQPSAGHPAMYDSIDAHNRCQGALTETRDCFDGELVVFRREGVFSTLEEGGTIQ
jgi:hypothetical protein